jgi:hypothetical protein
MSLKAYKTLGARLVHLEQILKLNVMKLGIGHPIGQVKAVNIFLI